MTTEFDQAAAGVPAEAKPLIIVSTFSGLTHGAILLRPSGDLFEDKFNIPLLRLLTDHAKNGGRVVLTDVYPDLIKKDFRRAANQRYLRKDVGPDFNLDLFEIRALGARGTGSVPNADMVFTHSGQQFPPSNYNNGQLFIFCKNKNLVEIDKDGTPSVPYDQIRTTLGLQPLATEAEPVPAAP